MRHIDNQIRGPRVAMSAHTPKSGHLQHLYVHFIQGNIANKLIFHREDDWSSFYNLSKKLPDELQSDSTVDWGREHRGKRVQRGGSVKDFEFSSFHSTMHPKICPSMETK